MTLQQIGDIMGCSPQLISQYETGKRTPKIETIINIATALDVSLFEVLSVDEYNKLINIQAEEQIQSDIKSGKIHVITEDEKELTTNYLKLDAVGKAEARKRVSELTEIPRYTKPDDLQKE